jgi:hypothetical protein
MLRQRRFCSLTRAALDRLCDLAAWGAAALFLAKRPSSLTKLRHSREIFTNFNPKVFVSKIAEIYFGFISLKGGECDWQDQCAVKG